MKTYIFRKIFIFCIATLPLGAAAQDVINYFSVAGDVRLPVKVSSSIGSFTISHNNTRVDGHISWLTAYDGQGRRILDNTYDSWQVRTGQPTIRLYIFKTLYPTGTTSNGDYSSSSSNYNSQTDQTIQNGIQSVGGSLIGGMTSVWAGSGYATNGYPNAQLQLGVSYAWGENVRGKLMLGDTMGFACWGGVGKDWLFNGKNKDMLLWNVGLGCYFTYDWFDEGDSDVTIGFTYGNAATWKDKVLLLEGSFSHFFGRSTRFGVLGGVGIGIGRINKWIDTAIDDDYDSKVNPTFAWDAHIGLAVKLWCE